MRPPSGATEPTMAMVTTHRDSRTDQEVRQDPSSGPVDVRGTPRSGDRLPRPERCRQIHHHADGARPRPADRRAPRRSTAGRSPSLSKPLRQVGALLDPQAAHGGRTARNHLLALAVSNGIPGRPGRSGAGAGRHRRSRQKRIKTFSLGMRQRLGIAAALLGDPAVLLFDEPTNGLDPEGIIWIRELLRELATAGRTVLVSSHLMSETALTVDHLVILAKGRLLVDMSMQEFIESRGAPRVRVRSAEPDRLRVALAVGVLYLQESSRVTTRSQTVGGGPGRSGRCDCGQGGHNASRTRRRADVAGTGVPGPHRRPDGIRLRVTDRRTAGLSDDQPCRRPFRVDQDTVLAIHRGIIDRGLCRHRRDRCAGLRPGQRVRGPSPRTSIRWSSPSMD